MSLAAAFRLLQRARRDAQLRARLNRAADEDERRTILEEVQCDCTLEEFEEACRALLVQCQDREQAGALAELRLWWMLLSRS